MRPRYRAWFLLACAICLSSSACQSKARAPISTSQAPAATPPKVGVGSVDSVTAAQAEEEAKALAASARADSELTAMANRDDRAENDSYALHAEQDKPNVIGFAKDFVRRSLVSSSGADFPWGYDSYRVRNLGSGIYTVSSWVDADNALGEKVHTSFTVKMLCTGKDHWDLMGIDTRP